MRKPLINDFKYIEISYGIGFHLFWYYRGLNRTNFFLDKIKIMKIYFFLILIEVIVLAFEILSEETPYSSIN